MIRVLQVFLAFAVGISAAAAPPWHNNWNDAFRIAKQQRKLVFVDFYADWCAPCRMMDEVVFPATDVQGRLRDYVLLRVDVDRASPSLKRRATKLPTYVIYDPEAQERFRFFGGMSEKDFIKRLNLAREGAPFMIKASDLFEQKREAEAWMEVARGYEAVHAPERARDAWNRARRAADSRKDRTMAQVAEMHIAFTWAMEDKGSQAAAELETLSRSAVTKENEALSYLLLGRVYMRMKNAARAQAALEKATALVPHNHVIATQAQAALAQLAELSRDPAG